MNVISGIKAWFCRIGADAPFTDELEPCVFYRVTPKAGPLIGGALILLIAFVAIAGVATGKEVEWSTLAVGLAIGAACVYLPKLAGRLPGSRTLERFEIELEHRLDRST